MKPIIVWFRQDLRLQHNPALYYAAQTGQPIIPVYILNTTLPKQYQIGSAQRWWLHHSLTALQKQFSKHQVKLILRHGDPATILADLIKKTNATAIYYNNCYEPDILKQDKILDKKLTVTLKYFDSYLLFKPWEIKNQQGNYFKVFTPFWKTCVRQLKLPTLLPIPKLKFYKKNIKSDNLNSWQLLPTKPNWAKGFEKIWEPGEIGAHDRFDRFLTEGLIGYSKNRDLPAKSATSQLSPHLHFGEITPAQIWHAVENYLSHHSQVQRDAEKFFAELGWREFSYHLLYHFPRLPHTPYQEKFAKFPWKKSSKQLRAWQQGKTGYPIVDAGMRQLWHTGWMHNRVRMIVASFLTKDLLLPWQTGAAWFWDTLVDADLANNSASWQWVAGSGADAAPYFRIFNPVLQSEKFDPQGDYIKRWIPELKLLSPKYIHQPWAAPKEILTAAKIKLGKNYPLPIIDHDEARLKALNIYKKLK